MAKFQAPSALRAPQVFRPVSRWRCSDGTRGTKSIREGYLHSRLDGGWAFHWDFSAGLSRGLVHLLGPEHDQAAAEAWAQEWVDAHLLVTGHRATKRVPTGRNAPPWPGLAMLVEEAGRIAPGVVEGMFARAKTMDFQPLVDRRAELAALPEWDCEEHFNLAVAAMEKSPPLAQGTNAHAGLFLLLMAAWDFQDGLSDLHEQLRGLTGDQYPTKLVSLLPEHVRAALAQMLANGVADAWDGQARTPRFLPMEELVRYLCPSTLLLTAMSTSLVY